MIFIFIRTSVKILIEYCIRSENYMKLNKNICVTYLAKDVIYYICLYILI